MLPSDQYGASLARKRMAAMAFPDGDGCSSSARCTSRGMGPPDGEVEADESPHAERISPLFARRITACLEAVEAARPPPGERQRRYVAVPVQHYVTTGFVRLPHHSVHAL